MEWHLCEGKLSKVGFTKLKKPDVATEKKTYLSVRDMGYIAMMGMFRRLTNQNYYQ